MYFLIDRFVRFGMPDNSFWWLAFTIKVGFGYLVYKFYIYKGTRLVIAGVVLTIVIIGLLLILYYTSRETIYPVVGSPSQFLLSVNTFFLYRYWRYPEDKSGRDHFERIPFLIIVVLFCLLFPFLTNVISYFIFTIFWITFHGGVLGFMPCRKRKPANRTGN